MCWLFNALFHTDTQKLIQNYHKSLEIIHLHYLSILHKASVLTTVLLKNIYILKSDQLIKLMVHVLITRVHGC